MKQRLVFILLFILVSGGWAAPVAAAQLPDSATVNGVVGHAQTYRLSCESRSAADLAAFWGVNVSETTFFAGLPRSDNPDVGFVGDVHGAWGNIPPNDYGVHAGPVAQLLRAYGLDAQAGRGFSLDDLRAEAAAGRPAIVWLVGNVWAGTPQLYTAQDGRQTTVAAFEHTFLFVGYTPTTVVLINAADGLTQYIRATDFLTSWSVLGNMAVLVRGLAPTVPPPSPTGQDGYTVQSGDRLASIAARFGVTWPDLARLNQLTFPYTIYPGQVLRLPGGTTAPSPPAGSIPSAGDSTYTVQAGEYLAQICRRLGLDWQAVAQLNGLYPPYTVYPGQVLRLPGSSATTPTLPATYLVQPGDTLAAVAARFGLDWPTLAALNNIPYPYQIYAYQELRLR
ncbi:MAG: LysM peptidoglycan-binding domain-containing protein [Anaerolineales bacterium]|nr:LysM peptidoglycan-binding domain-containing protein [Anaerolineales bacterium]MCB8953796.1 LysM peptidoglycan-binding domain-containing protein [Ardenticatenales bacterium]